MRASRQQRTALRRAPGTPLSGQVKFLRQEGAEDLLMVLLESWQILLSGTGWNWKKHVTPAE